MYFQNGVGIFNEGLEIMPYFMYFLKTFYWAKFFDLLFHGQSDCFYFLNVKYTEHVRILSFRITYNYIVAISELKNVYENVPYIMIYRAYPDK